MYMECLFEVSKAENGFVLECKVPIKSKDKKGGEGLCMPHSGEVKYVCKDIDDLFSKIKEVVPKLDMEYTSVDAFDKAFKAATMED